MAHKLGDAVAVFIDDNLVFPPPVTLKDKAIRKYSKAMLRGEWRLESAERIRLVEGMSHDICLCYPTLKGAEIIDIVDRVRANVEAGMIMSESSGRQEKEGQRGQEKGYW